MHALTMPRRRGWATAVAILVGTQQLSKHVDVQSNGVPALWN
jgi:hypothetical protein